MNKNNVLDLKFPDWSDHSPPPRLSNDEYIAWVEDHLSWLSPPAPTQLANSSANESGDVAFTL
jgi:hypothetical protein